METSGLGLSANLCPEQPRPRIIEALSAALHTAVLVLMAASAYGKTIAARQFFASRSGSKCWLSARTGPQTESQLLDAVLRAWGLHPMPQPSLPLLLQALPGTTGGLLVIDDANQWTDSNLWQTLAHLIDAAPAACHVLIVCRDTPPLPLMQWRNQGRVTLLNQSLLALTAEEWLHAGLPGGASACAASGGWWGAALALDDSSVARWNPALASWLHDVWFAALPPEQQDLFGMLSLIPQARLAEFRAISAWPTLKAEAAWVRVASLSGPVLSANDSLCILPLYRLYISQSWQQCNRQAWNDSVERTVNYLLLHGRHADAARLADEAGVPALQEQVLLQSGWALLYGDGRELLARLLEQNLMPDSPEVSLLRHAWTVEVMKTPHRVDSSLHAMLPHLNGELRGLALALCAVIAWDYDDFEKAHSQAAHALDCFHDAGHPAFILAELTLAKALAAEGHLNEADALLRRAHAGATRDRLLYLQLECQQRRALLASERGDFPQALQLLADLHSLALTAGVTQSSVQDSARRLLCWLHLRRLDLDAARTVENDTPPYWNFPEHLQQAFFALLDGDIGSARIEIDWLIQRLGDQFLCLKWQNESAFARLWLAASQFDLANLLELEQQLATDDWKPGLHRDRRRVLLAATRLLADRPDVQTELDALYLRLRNNGALALAHLLQLVIALSRSDKTALLQAVRASARHNDALDYLWLGSRCVAPLQKLLAIPELMHEPLTQDFVRGLLQKLLPAQMEPAPPLRVEAPGGLTAKEWQILQLIAGPFSNEQIAARLYISLATVKTHINHIYQKLGISNRTEAIHRAHQLGK